MSWITFIVYMLATIWILFDKATDERTPKIVAKTWKSIIASLAILIITSTTLAVILHENPAIVELAKRISITAIPLILILRIILPIACSILKLYNGKKALRSIDNFRPIGLPPPYNYQLFKEEYTLTTFLNRR